MITRPAASRMVARRMIVSPAAPTVACAGESASDAGGPAVTTTRADAVKPVTVAVTVYMLDASAVTSPVADTVRPVESLVDQATA